MSTEKSFRSLEEFDAEFCVDFFESVIMAEPRQLPQPQIMPQPQYSPQPQPMQSQPQMPQPMQPQPQMPQPMPPQQQMPQSQPMPQPQQMPPPQPIPMPPPPQMPPPQPMPPQQQMPPPQPMPMPPPPQMPVRPQPMPMPPMPAPQPRQMPVPPPQQQQYMPARPIPMPQQMPPQPQQMPQQRQYMPQQPQYMPPQQYIPPQEGEPKKKPRMPRRQLVFLVCTLVVAVALTLGIMIPKHMYGMEFVAMGSDAMGGSLPLGSLVVIQKAPFNEIIEGDIVTYTDAVGDLVTHRVASKRDEPPQIATKGDREEEYDPPVDYEAVRGVVRWHCQYAGYPLYWLRTAEMRIAAAAVAGILWLALFLMLGLEKK